MNVLLKNLISAIFVATAVSSVALAQDHPGAVIPEAGRLLITPSGLTKIGNELCFVLEKSGNKICEGQLRDFTHNHKDISLVRIAEMSPLANQLVQQLQTLSRYVDNLGVRDPQFRIEAQNIEYSSSFAQMSLRTLDPDNSLARDLPTETPGAVHFVMDVTVKQFNLDSDLVMFENLSSLYLPPPSEVRGASIKLADDSPAFVISLPFSLVHNSATNRFEVKTSKNISSNSRETKLTFDYQKFNMTPLEIRARCGASGHSETLTLRCRERVANEAPARTNADAIEYEARKFIPQLLDMIQELLIKMVHETLPGELDGTTFGPFFKTFNLPAAGSIGEDTDVARTAPVDVLFLGDQREDNPGYPHQYGGTFDRYALESCLIATTGFQSINTTQITLRQVMSCLDKTPNNTIQAAQWERIKYYGTQINECAESSVIESNSANERYTRRTPFFHCLGAGRSIRLNFTNESPTVVGRNVIIPIRADINDPNRPVNDLIPEELYSTQAADILSSQPIRAANDPTPDYDIALAINKGVINSYVKYSFDRGYFNEIPMTPATEIADFGNTKLGKWCENRARKALKKPDPNMPDKLLLVEPPVVSVSASDSTTAQPYYSDDTDRTPRVSATVNLKLNYIPQTYWAGVWLKDAGNHFTMKLKAGIHKVQDNGADALQLVINGADYQRSDVVMVDGYKSTGSPTMLKSFRNALACENLKWSPTSKGGLGRPIEVAKIPLPSQVMGLDIEVVSLKIDSNGHLIAYIKIKDK